jgi:hypothetical protein
MEEKFAIQTLEDLIRSLDGMGRDTASIRQFFDVGEWLIAFEGIEVAYGEVAADADAQAKIAWLRAYFDD